MLALLSSVRSPLVRFFTCFLSFFTTVFHLRTFPILLSFFIIAKIFRSLVVLFLLFMLGSTLFYLAFSALKIFKQTLLNKFLHCHSTSLINFFSLYLFFGLLPNKTDCKQIFDIIFINSYFFASN